MLVECINDQNWLPIHLKQIKNFPIKGEVYTVIGRNHTAENGLGYILDELDNPLLPNGAKVGFSAKRFKPVADIDLTEITKVLENEIVN